MLILKIDFTNLLISADRNFTSGTLVQIITTIALVYEDHFSELSCNRCSFQNSHNLLHLFAEFLDIDITFYDI
jgi:hypothetical protein